MRSDYQSATGGRYFRDLSRIGQRTSSKEHAITKNPRQNSDARQGVRRIEWHFNDNNASFFQDGADRFRFLWLYASQNRDKRAPSQP
jgi:hypothetical protein